MIEIQGLSYSHPRAGSPALRNISLNLPDQSFTAIMGANGSGKSTLARCLNGLLHPGAGRVLVDGNDTAHPGNVLCVRQHVGLVFQDPATQMTSSTVERELAFGLENLALPVDEMHARVEEHLTLFGFADRRHDSPHSLSAGEQQRLAIASVMILRRRYLVLDEATSLLSPRSRRSVLGLVNDLRSTAQIGVVLITQFPDEALGCDRLVVLRRGEVLCDGIPSDVFEHKTELQQAGIPIPFRQMLQTMS
jgi:energy-coupling factor transport system ATP-binding protein